ncbi:hypothetical protein ACFOOK_00835 [Micromonospora krabiensis]|nr:hypothetical protein [Micromonospora krabiensis]
MTSSWSDPPSTAAVTVESVGGVLVLRTGADAPEPLRVLAAALPGEDGRTVVLSAPTLTAGADFFTLLPDLLLEHLGGSEGAIRLVAAGGYAGSVDVAAAARELAEWVGQEVLVPTVGLTRLPGWRAPGAGADEPEPTWMVCPPDGPPRPAAAWPPAQAEPVPAESEPAPAQPEPVPVAVAVEAVVPGAPARREWPPRGPWWLMLRDGGVVAVPRERPPLTWLPPRTTPAGPTPRVAVVPPPDLPGVRTRAGWSFVDPPTDTVVPALAGFVVEIDVDRTGFRVGGRPTPPRMLARLIASCRPDPHQPVVVVARGATVGGTAADLLYGGLADALAVPVHAADAPVRHAASGLLWTTGTFRCWSPRRARPDGQRPPRRVRPDGPVLPALPPPGSRRLVPADRRRARRDDPPVPEPVPLDPDLAVLLDPARWNVPAAVSSNVERAAATAPLPRAPIGPVAIAPKVDDLSSPGSDRVETPTRPAGRRATSTGGAVGASTGADGEERPDPTMTPPGAPPPRVPGPLAPGVDRAPGADDPVAVHSIDGAGTTSVGPVAVHSAGGAGTTSAGRVAVSGANGAGATGGADRTTTVGAAAEAVVGAAGSHRTTDGPPSAGARSVAPRPAARWLPGTDPELTVANRAALRQAVGARYDAYARVVSRTLAESPGLRATVGTAADLAAGLVAVRAYQDGERERVNEVLRGGGPDDEAARSVLLARWATYGLRRLPSVFGPVFRCAPADVADVAAYRPGAVLAEPAFVDVDLAVGPAPSPGVEFAIWSASAHRLGALAVGAGQGGALFPPGSRFLVLAVEEPTGTAAVARVLLQDLGARTGGAPHRARADPDRILAQLRALPRGGSGGGESRTAGFAPGLDDYGRPFAVPAESADAVAAGEGVGA